MVKLYTLCLVFFTRDYLVGLDINGKFHQGSDGNCQTLHVKKHNLKTNVKIICCEIISTTKSYP